jgi:hypothetical protein
MQSGLLSMAQEFSGLPMESLIGGPLKAAAEGNSMMAMTFTKFMLDTCFAKIPIGVTPAVVGSPADLTTTPITPAVISSPEIPAHDSYIPVMVKMSLTRAVLTPGTAAVTAVTGSAAVAATPGTPATATTPAIPPTPAIPEVPAMAAQPAQPAAIQNFTTTFDLPLLTIMPLNSLAVETVDITFDMEVKSSFAEDASQETVTQKKSEGSFEAKAGWGPFSVSIKGSASYDSKSTDSSSQHYKKENSAKYTVNVHAGQLPLPKGVGVILEAFAGAIQPITLGQTS